MSPRKVQRRKSETSLLGNNSNDERSSTTLSTTSINASPRKRWTETIRTVLNEQEDKNRRSLPPRKTAEPRDRLGEEIARQLNACSEFSWQQHQPAGEGEAEIDEQSQLETGLATPLLSSRNIHRVKSWLLRIEWAPHRLLYNIFRFCGQTVLALFRYRTSIRSALRVFVWTLVLSTLGLVFLFHTAIVWLVRTGFAIASLVLSLLVDFDDLKSSCPRFLVWTWALLMAVGRAVDRILLLGGRIGGRDWDRDRHLKNNGEPLCPSRVEPLWQCPPPLAVQLGRRNCMDEQVLAQVEPYWSRATIQHVMAIQYCYIMMHDDHVRKKASNGGQQKRRGSTLLLRRLSLNLDDDDSQDGNDIMNDTQSNDLSPIPQNDSDDSFTVDELLPQLDISASEETQRRSGGAHRTRIRARSISKPGEERRETIEVMRRRSSLGSRGRSYSDTDIWGSSDFMESLRESDDDDYHSDTSPGSSRGQLSPAHRHRHRMSSGSLLSNESEIGDELDWLDVGTRIGMRILNSEHLQRAVASQDTAERFIDISKQVEHSLKGGGTQGPGDHGKNGEGQLSSPLRTGTGRRIVPPPKPIHAMWTSPVSTADEARQDPSVSSLSGADDDTLGSLTFTPRPGRSVQAENGMTPSMIAVESKSNEMKSQEHSSPPRTTSRSYEETRLETLSEAAASPAKRWNRRPRLAEGVKVVVPMIPIQPGNTSRVGSIHSLNFQMGTVVESKRILVRAKGQKVPHGMGFTNCLAVKVKLDKSFLRNGEFAELTFRVMDTWSSRYMPRHSKFPVGACVATSYGLGVLVGWRVEDDCHIVRSLWQRRGPGTAHAYLNRDALHDVAIAGVGFRVSTKLGSGTVLAYTNGGKDFRFGRYFVLIREEGRNKGKVLEFARNDILTCNGARFVPIIEHIREAAQFQIRVDTYESALRREAYEGNEVLTRDEKLRRLWSRGAETIWVSLLKALEEDREFDDGMNEFISSIISFLDRLEDPSAKSDAGSDAQQTSQIEEKEDLGETSKLDVRVSQDAGAWLLNGVFGGMFQYSEDLPIEVSIQSESLSPARPYDTYDRIYAVIRVLMRTSVLARAASPTQPNLRLALSVIYEGLLFVRTVVRVQQKNISPHSMEVWRLAADEIASVFGPIKDRLQKIGLGIAQRIEKQGKRAKVRLLRFVDLVLVDEELLDALGRGDWPLCLERTEDAMVKARIIDADSRENYHKTIMFIYDQLVPSTQETESRSQKNGSLQQFALVLSKLASPRRSLLKLICQDDILEILERVLVRVFNRHKDASRMLTIHASNFQTVRQLRMLKDFSIAAKLWMPLLDAADAEFTWNVSKMTGKAQDLLLPVSKLFTMYVSQCHKIAGGDLTVDWLDFLMEDAAVKLIREIDMKLITLVEALCHDLKEIMVVLPYYPSIDDDILKLMDEVDLDEFLREASEAIEDPDKLAEFVREKSTIAIERFLDYLPKMSIPVDRRDIGDGWVLTCQGEDGGDLTLSDLQLKKENLTCEVLGGDPIFFPMFGDDLSDVGSAGGSSVLSGESSLPVATPSVVTEASILDQIRDILLEAQKNGYWRVGVGGVDKPPTDRYVASVLHGLPVTSVLDCAIELWRNLEMDDDELLEIAIRDVSYQMKLSTVSAEQDADNPATSDQNIPPIPEGQVAAPTEMPHITKDRPVKPEENEHWHRRFNPRIDPTVLFMEMRNLTLNLDRFNFRIEKAERRSIFDPVFEGRGTVTVRNIRIKLRVECKKRRIKKLGADLTVPVLQVNDLEVGLERVKMKVKDTGLDWLLNNVVKGFARNITEAVQENLQEQVRENLDGLMENLNNHFVVNPDLLLNLLGITMKDLEETTATNAEH